MPTFLSYSAWIEVDEERLPEYGITEEMTPDGWSKVTCWIPSTVGKIFRIGYGEARRLTASEVIFSVDGHRCPGARIIGNKDRVPEVPSPPTYRKGIQGPLGLLPFAFGSCQLTDDESAPLFVEGLGEIQVDFYETRIIRKYEKRKVEFDSEHPVALSPQRRIHEKAKKALVHKVELKEEPIAPPAGSRRCCTTQQGAKRVQFIFKYRPLDVLRATEVVPHRLAAGIAAATSTANVQRDLTVDRKPSVTIDLTLPPPRRRATDAPREVIDLTVESDDDDDKSQALIARLQNELAAAKERMGKNKRKRSERDVDEDATRRVKQEPIKTESSDRTAL